jgi:uncharacterized protein (DUF1330 family)
MIADVADKLTDEEKHVTTTHRIMLTAAVGAAIGAVGALAIQGPRRKSAPGYFVAEIEVTDPSAMRKYGERVPETLAPFHHHYVVRGGKPQALEGEPSSGVVVIAFDNVAKAKEWYESPAYRALIPLRQSASKGRIFLVEGVPE